MCGIAGFTRPGLQARGQLQAMLDAIAHRGPDGSGLFLDSSLALGHCRLAIVDLSGGAQPRVDAATGDALSFNGEIYGHRALAEDLARSGIALRDRCDTEVLFQLIRRDGLPAAVARIDGMFAFAYRDGRSGSLHLVRDRYGEKPLYYGIAGGQLVFGSEAGAVLAHPAFRQAVPDQAAAYQLLQFEYIPGQASGWAGISKLRPGTMLRFADGRAEVAEYWRPHVGGGAVQDAEAVDRLDALLQDAVGRQGVADVPLGVFLSGGLDSSLLTAMAARHNPDITAFTVQVGGHGFDETPYAEEVAHHLRIAHEVVHLGDADVLAAADALQATLSEPLADSSLLPTWLVCRAARQRMTVALGGDGADEMFGGYPNFKAQRLAGLMRLLPAASGAALSGALGRLPGRGGYMSLPFKLAQLSQGFGQAPARQSAYWMAPFGLAAMAQLWSADVDQGALREQAFAAAGPQPGEGVDGLLHGFLTGYLPDDILMKTDRAAMFNGLEVRAPFLDRAFAEYACALPTRFKLRRGVGKWALKQVARRYLPDRIVHRRKHGFGVPIGALLRTLLRERCEDTILSRCNPVAPWFNPAELERLVQEHMTGARDHGKRLWALHILFTVAGRQSAPARAMPARDAGRRLIGMPA